MDTVKEENWFGIYREKWGDILIPEAFDHPAKAAYGLCERIYQHILERGYVNPGDTVLDVFSGIGGLAYHAMVYGLNFVGVELEQKFYDIAMGCDCTGVSAEDWKRYQGRIGRIRYKDGRHICPRCVSESRMVDEKYDKRQLSLFGLHETASYRRNSGKIPVVSPHHYTGNIEVWTKKPGMKGSAVMFQGDSRELLEILEVRFGAPDGSVSSPPYNLPMSQDHSGRGGGKRGSTPSEDGAFARYGDTPGQLEGLQSTEEGYGAAITSPPFAQTTADGGYQMLGKYADQGKLTVDQVKGDKRKVYPSWSKERDTDYAPSQENLGNLKSTDDGYGAAITSPPYAETRIAETGDIMSTMRRSNDGVRYGGEEGQLGTMKDGDFSAAISSPPYAETKLDSLVTRRVYEPQNQDGTWKRGNFDERKSLGERDSYGLSDGQLGHMKDGGISGAISSPPYHHTRVDSDVQRKAADPKIDLTEIDDGMRHYGDEDGQLSMMKEGDISAALSSPPYGDIAQSGGIKGLIERNVGLTRGQRSFDEYGSEEGQLGKMGVEGFEASLSSPPYEAAIEKRSAGSGAVGRGEFPVGRSERAANEEGYGHTDGQMGGDVGQDFWMAARTIVDQVYAALKPGGVSVWIVKNYIRDGKVVEFSKMWERLCQAAGFETVEWIKAWFIEEGEAQIDFEGNHHKKRVKRSSFFRRLYETKYPENAIDFEDVIILRKGA